HTYGQRLVDAVGSGRIPEAHVDRALTRVLTQKCELGLLDPDWSPVPPVLRDGLGESADPAQLPEAAPGSVDLDTPANRALARHLAEQSVILLDNKQGLLPLRKQNAGKVAVVGPLADEASAMLGCYSFPMHVGPQHP